MKSNKKASLGFLSFILIGIMLLSGAGPQMHARQNSKPKLFTVVHGDWLELFGPATLDAPPLRYHGGPAIYAVGFNQQWGQKPNGKPRARSKALRRTKNTIATAQPPFNPDVTASLDALAYSLEHDPDYLPTVTAQAIQSILVLWQDSGTFRLPRATMTCAEAARRYPVQNLAIYFASKPWYQPLWNFDVNGETFSSTSIKVVIASIYYYFDNDNHSKAYLIEPRNMIAWEFGNALAEFAGYQPQGNEPEVGSNQPSQMTTFLFRPQSDNISIAR